jgi:glycerol transport system ATP-binding protein
VLDRRASGLTADAKQKISLGRGLVREDVAAVLFDEPLTVIDPHLKWQLRRKLKQIHHELKLTLVYVTHDQVEALTFADQVMVMSEGRVVQAGTAEQLFEDPSHMFVGHFIGSPGMNFLPGHDRQWGAADRRRAPDRRGDRTGHALAVGAAGDFTGCCPGAGHPAGIRDGRGDDADGAVEAITEKVQDLGTSILITARVGASLIKVRAPVQTDLQTSLATAGPMASGRRLRLSVINRHSRFYRNQDLIT